MRKETSTNYQNERHLLSDCPFSRTLDVLGGRWRPAVLWKILCGARRFGALTRAIPAVSEKMLAQELRELEARGLVRRVVVSERPLHVEYLPTPLGASLEPVLRQMYEWAEGPGAQASEAFPR